MEAQVSRTVVAIAAIMGLAVAALVAIADEPPTAVGQEPSTATAPRFRLVALPSPAIRDSVLHSLEPDAFAVMLRLNRMDADHAQRADSLLIPEAGTLSADAPFPDRIESAAALPKALVIACRVQSFGAYEFGQRVRMGPVSSGARDDPTQPGLYFVNWIARRHVSTQDSTWLMRWTVNFGARDGRAIHQNDLPGYPASHSCVRLLEDDARWLYSWVNSWRVSKDDRTVLANGTPIAIVGVYTFGARRPWRALEADPHATDLTPAELSEADSLLRVASAGDSAVDQLVGHDVRRLGEDVHHPPHQLLNVRAL
jgi:lipoprotein-anchoring transpeptidase ErfK/SrfK